MARRILVASIGVALASLGGACATQNARPMTTAEAVATPLPARPADPPAVLTGEGELHCTIDARANGRQQLEITSGGGLEFDAVVSPIVDGTVTANGPDKGGAYRFTSHLAAPAKGKLPGTGDVEIDELETKVAVEMKRYQQPGGRGTNLTFTSDDMSRRGIYVEFAGKAHTASGERYSFRVNLGAPIEGSGKVTPANDNAIAPMAAKVVYIRAPISTVLVTTSLQHLP
jgi:hypothetical protein